MTAQMHEILILDGRRTSMAYCPSLPLDEGWIVSERADSHDDETDRILSSTACWRGYQGTWEIRDGRFYLVSLKGRYNLVAREPVFADWFFGVLRIPQGELLEYVHMGFGSVYEEELHIKIEGGMVVDSRTIDNRNKIHNWYELGLKNLPGGENSFAGDDF